MLTTNNIIISIIIISTVTFSTRAFPFILFGSGNKKPPDIIMYLGKYLPPAIISAILIYCFSDISFFTYPSALKEIVAVTVVVILQLWKNNSMLSIFSGTAIYMILTQVVFPT